ncbi:MAG: aspartyl protease family protein [Gammaproteobacteria bacterium]|nr:aspartyl protease family protein [Gammaproteobacteria bacterium]
MNFLMLAALFALPGCAGVLDLDGALAVTPYRIEENGRIVIEARVNGEGPFNFALDTGASISAVFEQLNDKLELERIPGKVVIVHGVVSSGKFPILDVDRLEVGREVWPNPRIVLLPGATDAGKSVDGVLGIDFLQRFAVGFSTRDRVVRLYPPELVARRSYRGWASVPLEFERVGERGAALYFMAIEIDGHKIPALFDLGAGLNMINWVGARSLGIEPRDVRRKEQVSGALEDERQVAGFVAAEVTTANIRWRNESFSIADLAILETLMLDGIPVVILGAGLFTQRDFVIDFARRRLLVNVEMKEAGANEPGIMN